MLDVDDRHRRAVATRRLEDDLGERFRARWHGDPDARAAVRQVHVQQQLAHVTLWQLRNRVQPRSTFALVSPGAFMLCERRTRDSQWRRAVNADASLRASGDEVAPSASVARRSSSPAMQLINVPGAAPSGTMTFTHEPSGRSTMHTSPGTAPSGTVMVMGALAIARSLLACARDDRRCFRVLATNDERTRKWATSEAGGHRI